MSMNYNPKSKPRINHFILWCKHWYIPTNADMPLIEQCKRILKLDEYVCVKNVCDVLCILTNFIDDYNEYCKKHNFPNHFIDGEVAYIKSVFQKCLAEDRFIKGDKNERDS